MPQRDRCSANVIQHSNLKQIFSCLIRVKIVTENNFLTDKELTLISFRDSYEDGEFNDMDYKFLIRILMHEDIDLEHYITGDNETLEDVEEYLDIYTYHANEFRDGVYTTVEGAILVFEFVELVYINEYGNEFKTDIIRD